MSDDLSGSEDIPAENVKRELVPPPIATPEKTQNQTDWDEALIKEARNRIRRRTCVYLGVGLAAVILFGAFLFYLFLIYKCPWRQIDHMLLWLLAVLPIGLVFVLIKLTSEPKKDEAITLWPDELIKLGHKAVDGVVDIAKKKLGG